MEHRRGNGEDSNLEKGMERPNAVRRADASLATETTSHETAHRAQEARADMEVDSVARDTAARERDSMPCASKKTKADGRRGNLTRQEASAEG